MFQTHAAAAAEDAACPGEVFMIHPHHCVDKQLSVYNVGSAGDAAQVLQQFPEGSILIARLRVSNMQDSEAFLLDLCHARFIHRQDLGTGCFCGGVTGILAALITTAELFPPLLPMEADVSVLDVHYQDCDDDSESGLYADADAHTRRPTPSMNKLLSMHTWRGVVADGDKSAALC